MTSFCHGHLCPPFSFTSSYEVVYLLFTFVHAGGVQANAPAGEKSRQPQPKEVPGDVPVQREGVPPATGLIHRRSAGGGRHDIRRRIYGSGRRDVTYIIRSKRG
eukprot:1195492-Prorocentrum_minimum.AAC.3